MVINSDTMTPTDTVFIRWHCSTEKSTHYMMKANTRSSAPRVSRDEAKYAQYTHFRKVFALHAYLGSFSRIDTLSHNVTELHRS